MSVAHTEGSVDSSISRLTTEEATSMLVLHTCRPHRASYLVRSIVKRHMFIYITTCSMDSGAPRCVVGAQPVERSVGRLIMICSIYIYTPPPIGPFRPLPQLAAVPGCVAGPPSFHAWQKQLCAFSPLLIKPMFAEPGASRTTMSPPRALCSWPLLASS